jgi:ribose 5-phosphate isomerase B
MRIGIATDHGGFDLKEELVGQLRAAGHEIVDFGANILSPDDDYPDFVTPLGHAVAAGEVERGVAICGIGVCQQDSRRTRSLNPRSLLGAAGGRG